MRWACCALWMVSSRASAPLRMCDSSISPYLTRNAFIPIRDERVVRGATQIKLLETKKSPMMHSGKSQLHSFRVQPIMENNDLYPSPITGAFRQRLLVWFRYGAYAPPAQPPSVHLAARRAIRRCRFWQGFHQLPALCTVVQRVLVLFIAFYYYIDPNYISVGVFVNITQEIGECRL